MITVKKQIELLKQKREYLRQQIKKHNINMFSDEELNTWDEKKLKHIHGKIQLHVSKEIFKSQLKKN
jgi:hypothetical protein